MANQAKKLDRNAKKFELKKIPLKNLGRVSNVEFTFPTGTCDTCTTYACPNTDTCDYTHLAGTCGCNTNGCVG